MKKLCLLFFSVFISLNIFSQYQTIYKEGDNGYKSYRIPALNITKKGTILAFAEARKYNSSDTGDIDLVVRRSTDNGKTWGDMIMFWDDKENVCGNPSATIDPKTGRIILTATWNHGKDHEYQILNGTSKYTRRPFVMFSDDDGLTWSEPVDITEQVKDPSWTWFATGPCHAIKLQNSKHKGRIVVPCTYGEKSDQSRYHSLVIYSDDNGKSWKTGGITERGGNECTIVELANGDLMLNMRNYNRDKGQCRSVVISKDGGETFSEMSYDDQLVEPVCQGSILNLTDKKGKLSETILFSNPASLQRKNLSIKTSFDSGKTWPKTKQIFEGHSAYSDIVILKNGDIGILFEHGEKNAYENISFQIIPRSEFSK